MTNIKRNVCAEGWGAVCFALMRIAIGWHFLYEGLWKLMQPDGWSCVSYLGAAQGPYCIETGWTMGTIPAVMMFDSRPGSYWAASR